MSAPWLALDTATDVASVAAGVPPHAAAAVMHRGARRQAADVLTLVADVLGRAGLELSSVRGLVVGDGPGSFTGLRVGWAAARGLAHEREVPVVAVPSLLAAASGAAAAGAAVVAACFDALRGQVFGALYRFAGDHIQVLVAPSLVTVPELARIAPVRPAAVVGDGAVRYAADVYTWCGMAPRSLDTLRPGAASLLWLAARPGVARTLDPWAEPEYGRPAEAQVKWEERHGRPLPDSPSRFS